MLHWPKVMVTYDTTDKVLFSADGFGKYGAQVQSLLKKAVSLDIKIIYPLHGSILKENLGYYLNLYNIWSSYQVETEEIA